MGKPKDWDDEMDGEWEPPMIDNPEYNADDAKDIGKYEENCKIGFDLWQVKSGTIFDNILITWDVEHAKKVGEELWAVTKEAEKKRKRRQRQTPNQQMKTKMMKISTMKNQKMNQQMMQKMKKQQASTTSCELSASVKFLQTVRMREWTRRMDVAPTSSRTVCV